MHAISKTFLGFGIWTVSNLLLTPVPARAIEVEQISEFTGQKVGDRFGTSVSPAGDFNGDGHADIIVGSNLATIGGRAYILFGGPGSDDIPDVFLVGEALGDNFGGSVGTAGDFNGDGYDDVIVGALGADLSSNEGAAYLYLGGASPDSIPDLIFIGWTANERLGFAVGTAGDLNNDGYADLVLGARQALGNTGRVYVHFGSASPDTVPDVVLVGEASGDRFGSAVGATGDVNGDGYDDMIVGATTTGSSPDPRGLAYLFLGGATVDSLPDLRLHGEAAGDLFGLSVNGAGDVNGDGYDDVIVGAPSNDAGGDAAGRAYIFFGGAAPDTTADVVMTGQSAGWSFGRSVASAGDLNQDGYDDFLVGANSLNNGRAYFFYGDSGVDPNAELVLVGDNPGDNFGQSVSTAGDFDGDGFTDILVGAPLAGSGMAYVYTIYPFRLTAPNGGETWFSGDNVSIDWRGSDSADLEISFDGGSSWGLLVDGVGGNLQNSYPFVVPAMPTDMALIRVTFAGQIATSQTSDASDGTFTIVERYDPPGLPCSGGWSIGEGPQDGYGNAAGTLGDFTQDGFDDFVVGAPRNGAAGVEAGRAYVYFGAASLDTIPDLILTGETAGDRYGHAVASAGDINLDGYPDLVVGAYDNDAAGSEAGRVYLYYGGMTPDPVPDLVFGGPAALRNLGWSVAGAGDPNGDGFDDLLVGAVGDSTDPGLSGWAYLYFGGVSPDTLPDLVLTGESGGDGFGYSVASAGDFNGDGYDDLVVGAVHAGGDFGRAYVYYGGPGLDATPDLVLGGEATGDAFGTRVAPVGDINGDGYDDLFVGAPNNDVFGIDAGRAYVYFGGAVPDTVPDIVYTGERLLGHFGWSGGTAGDINDDGYPDVIVGAPDTGPTDTGEVYVFHGGPAVDNDDDIYWFGILAYAQIGYSAGTAGDMNGDGVDDYFIGAGGVSGVTVQDCGPQQIGVPEIAPGPGPLVLAPPYPNPRRSSGALEVRFGLPEGDRVELSLFDVQGRRLASAPPQRFASGGDHLIRWDPGPIPAGRYFLELKTAGGLRATRSLCILR